MKMDIQTYSQLNPNSVNFDRNEIHLGCINSHSPMVEDFRVSLSKGFIDGTYNRTEVGRCLDLVTYKSNVDGTQWTVSYSIDSSD